MDDDSDDEAHSHNPSSFFDGNEADFVVDTPPDEATSCSPPRPEEATSHNRRMDDASDDDVSEDSVEPWIFPMKLESLAEVDHFEEKLIRL